MVLITFKSPTNEPIAPSHGKVYPYESRGETLVLILLTF